MYPLCPYHAAWKPGRPLGVWAGGGMPGPMLLVHVAARDATGRSATRSALASNAFRTVPTTIKTFERDARSATERRPSHRIATPCWRVDRKSLGQGQSV